MAMPERICAYRAYAQHREIHNQRLIKSPPRPGYQQIGEDWRTELRSGKGTERVEGDKEGIPSPEFSRHRSSILHLQAS